MDNASVPSSTLLHTSLVASDIRSIRLNLLTVIPISFAIASSVFSFSPSSPFFLRPAFCFIPSIFIFRARERS